MGGPLRVPQAGRRMHGGGDAETLERAVGITAVVFDKTGTLTQNEMTVRTVVTGQGSYDVEGWHMRSRAEVGEILRGYCHVTEFRAGPIIGSGSASFEMVRYLTERLPMMVTPKWVLNSGLSPSSTRSPSHRKARMPTAAKL